MSLGILMQDIDNWKVLSDDEDGKMYRFEVPEDSPILSNLFLIKKMCASIQCDLQSDDNWYWFSHWEFELLNGSKLATYDHLKNLHLHWASDFDGCVQELDDAFSNFVALLRSEANALEAAGGETLLTVSDVAERLKTPRNTILNWIKAGKIKAFRIGKKWLIHKKDISPAMERSAGSAVLSTETNEKLVQEAKRNA
jgi:excisionase family DNA binding protein